MLHNMINKKIIYFNVFEFNYFYINNNINIILVLYFIFLHCIDLIFFFLIMKRNEEGVSWQ